MPCVALATEPRIKETVEIARAAKELSPDKPVVLGGWQTSLTAPIARTADKRDGGAAESGKYRGGETSALAVRRRGRGMTPMTLEAFDTLAARYDELWTRSAVGRSQRGAVWRHLDPLFEEGDTVLDLGCGTGEDVLHFNRRGIRARGIDKSEEMVRMARERGVNASLLPIEQIEELTGEFDGVISNFGALNCVSNLAALRKPLARLVRPGGSLAICVMGPFCPWETVWYLAHGRPQKAVRRWGGLAHSPSIGIAVYYPSAKAVERAFGPDFELDYWTGIGLFVPPSYVGGATQGFLGRLEAIDRAVAHWPVLRAAADHRLFVFRRR